MLYACSREDASDDRHEAEILPGCRHQFVDHRHSITYVRPWTCERGALGQRASSRTIDCPSGIDCTSNALLKNEVSTKRCTQYSSYVDLH